MREVVVRFDEPGDSSSPGQVQGIVHSSGDPETREFTGWLQLIGHLEMLSGFAAAQRVDVNGDGSDPSRDEPATIFGRDRRG